MHACTLTARNSLAPVLVLADTFFAHHPTASFTTLVIGWIYFSHQTDKFSYVA